MCDARNTVQFNELFAMRKKNGNGQPDEGVCDIRYTTYSSLGLTICGEAEQQKQAAT